MTDNGDVQQCSARVYGERVQSWDCQRKGVLFEKGKWWCRQHAPSAEAARVKARNARYAAEAERSDRLYREGVRLCAALGVDEWVYHSKGTRAAIVLSFTDAERLIARLEKR